MPDKSWKANERRFAADVGSKRKPCDGSRDGVDFEDSLCAYQLKVRKIFPAWLWHWLSGIIFRAEQSNRVGVLVVKQPGDRDESAIVMVKWRDWVQLHGDARRRADGQKANGKSAGQSEWDREDQAFTARKARAAQRPQSKPARVRASSRSGTR